MNSVGVLRKVLGRTVVQCLCVKQGKTSLSPGHRTVPLTKNAWVTSTEQVRYYSQLKHLNVLIKGITTNILRFANSFREMKNKRLINRINKYIDPSFTLDTFATDVTYAFSKLSHLLATRQYRKIRELTYGGNDGPVTFLQEYVESLLDQDLVQHVDFTPDAFSVLDPYVVEIVTQDDVHAVVVDAAGFGVKFIEDQVPVMMHLHVRFAQAYSKDSTSGWLVVDVPFIHIRKFSHMKSEL